MKALIVVLLLVFFVFTDSKAQHSSLDTTYTRSLRLFDNTNATLSLYINGKNWDDNVNVTFKVIFQGKQILYRDLKNVFIEKKYFLKENFSDYPNCNSYVDCKKYFFSHLIIDVVRSSEKNRYTKSADRLTMSMIKNDFSEKVKGKSSDEINQLVDKFVNHLLHDSYDILWIPDGPFLVSEILVYNRDIRSFINIHTE
jgi:hypothetical protein